MAGGCSMASGEAVSEADDDGRGGIGFWANEKRREEIKQERQQAEMLHKGRVQRSGYQGIGMRMVCEHL